MGIFNTKKKPRPAVPKPSKSYMAYQLNILDGVNSELGRDRDIYKNDPPATIIESVEPIKKVRQRKVSDEDIKSRKITIRITDREYDILEDYSHRTGDSISSTIRKILIKNLDI